MPAHTVHLSLGSNVFQILRNKIIYSAYIDLAFLLDNLSLHDDTEKQIYIGEKGELITKGVSKAKDKNSSINSGLLYFIFAYIVLCVRVLSCTFSFIPGSPEIYS